MTMDSYEDDDQLLARPTDPWTSHAAIPTDEKIGRAQLQFLRTLNAAHRALNAYEVCDLAERDGLWRRSNELERKGFIKAVGQNISPRSGKMCRTFEVTPFGGAFLMLKRGKNK